MKKLTTAIIIVALVALSPSSLMAQSATPSASDQTVTENLKKRLQESLESAKQNIITDVNEGINSPIAYVGVVQDVIQESVDIKTKDGQRYAGITEDTTIIRTPGGSEIELDDIRIEDFIIAMGYQQNNTSLTAKRIIVSQTVEPQLPKTSGRGVITDITPSSITILANEEEKVINLVRSTIVKSQDEALELEDLEEGQTIVYTADVDDEEHTATIIMIIKQPEPSPTPQEEEA